MNCSRCGTDLSKSCARRIHETGGWRCLLKEAQNKNTQLRRIASDALRREKVMNDAYAAVCRERPGADREKIAVAQRSANKRVDELLIKALEE